MSTSFEIYPEIYIHSSAVKKATVHRSSYCYNNIQAHKAVYVYKSTHYAISKDNLADASGNTSIK